MAQLVKCLLYTSMIAWVQVLGTTHGKSQAWGCLSVVPAAGRETGGSLQLSRISELRVQREIDSKIQVANSGGGHLTNVKLWLLHTYAYVHYHMYTHTPHCTPHTPSVPRFSCGAWILECLHLCCGIVFLEGCLHGPQLQSVVVATLILQALRNDFFPCNWLNQGSFPLN